METLLVRLKPYDPRRGFKLRRFTFAGIRFQPEQGWYRVEKSVGEYLRSVRATTSDEHSPPAFDVHTDTEAQALDDKEADKAKQVHRATDHLELVPARPVGTVTTPEPSAATPAKPHSGTDREPRRGKRA